MEGECALRDPHGQRQELRQISPTGLKNEQQLTRESRWGGDVDRVLGGAREQGTGIPVRGKTK